MKKLLNQLSDNLKAFVIGSALIALALAIVAIWACETDTQQVYRRSPRPYIIGWHSAYGGDTVSFDTTGINIVAITSSSGAIEYTYQYNTYQGNQCSISFTDINGGSLQQGDVLTSRAVTYFQSNPPENDTLFELVTPYPAYYTATSDTCRIDLGWCVSPFNGLSVQAFILLNCN